MIANFARIFLSEPRTSHRVVVSESSRGQAKRIARACAEAEMREEIGLLLLLSCPSQQPEAKQRLTAEMLMSRQTASELLT